MICQWLVNPGIYWMVNTAKFGFDSLLLSVNWLIASIGLCDLKLDFEPWSVIVCQLLTATRSLKWNLKAVVEIWNSKLEVADGCLLCSELIAVYGWLGLC